MDGWPISSRIIGKNLKNLPPPKKKKTKNRICIQQEVHQTAAENPKKTETTLFLLTLPIKIATNSGAHYGVKIESKNPTKTTTVNKV